MRHLTWIPQPNHGIPEDEIRKGGRRDLHSSYTGDNIIVLSNNINAKNMVRHSAGMTAAI
jgi:hypothetical protein